MQLLKNNQDKFNQWNLMKNSNIFTYDYNKMKEIMKKSGISKNQYLLFHLKNMNKWIWDL